MQGNRMKIIVFILVASLLAACHSFSSTSRLISHNDGLPVMSKPRMYIKTLPSRGPEGRKGRITVAMWDSGLLVWDASLHGDPQYCHVWLPAEDRQRIDALLTTLELAAMASTSHAVPSSSFVEIGIASSDHDLRKYIWDEHPSSIGGAPDIRDSFIRAWIVARGSLDLIRPCCGQPLTMDAKAADEFSATFPGY